MLTIIVNAYAIDPHWGSEPGMGWNWVINLAKYCRLHVITEGEWRENIETALSSLPQADHLTFHYLPVSPKVREMCRNQGDWRFYWYYRQWQKRALEKARQIIAGEHIDIVHQLNMIGFREPGYLWQITEIPFVWGPIGGMNNFPLAYLKGAGLKQQLFVRIKNAINRLQYHYQPRVRQSIRKADALVAAINEVKVRIEQLHNRSVALINETGCYISDSTLKEKKEKDTLDIIWVGKFDFRKQLKFALQIMHILSGQKEIKLHICGTGTNNQVLYYKDMAAQLKLQDTVIWHGKVAHDEVLSMMQHSDLFLFTSIAEGTPHVVLEAIGNNLPVICFDCCGMGDIVDESIGRKIPLSTPYQSAMEFANAIEELYFNSDIREKMSLACTEKQKELSWSAKALQVYEIYKNLASSHIE